MIRHTDMPFVVRGEDAVVVEIRIQLCAWSDAIGLERCNEEQKGIFQALY